MMLPVGVIAPWDESEVEMTEWVQHGETTGICDVCGRSKYLDFDGVCDLCFESEPVRSDDTEDLDYDSWREEQIGIK